ncbi:antibiotic biosynthesis monooxygenase (ABM) superfamily enzyme [Lysobacter niabensis]|uniref:Antibiotic biosynthesis monooxygenase (ABM) superfamily enzyme n=1 Tax=Agrilutibacter niabensis TaxID=380628 RepID=A0ABU1VN95_9GAMM|nr:antibiotic biosynthesis monooxygenase [Lysobacter niabensis]MDR7098952.1 antibiotic biosynthesis monooxygenase (ABM) superfamily enzyme [Lysobacter niabensis]
MNTASAASVIVHDVDSAHREDYELWAMRAAEAHRRAPGYLATEFIRPNGHRLRYIVLVRFDSEAHAQEWLKSHARLSLLKEAEPWLLQGDRAVVHREADFWFVPEPDVAWAPKRYKQWLASFAAIFPLTIVVPASIEWLSAAAGLKLEPLLASTLYTGIISGLMVYILMPMITRSLGRWLVR